VWLEELESVQLQPASTEETTAYNNTKQSSSFEHFFSFSTLCPDTPEAADETMMSQTIVSQSHYKIASMAKIPPT